MRASEPRPCPICIVALTARSVRSAGRCTAVPTRRPGPRSNRSPIRTMRRPRCPPCLSARERSWASVTRFIATRTRVTRSSRHGRKKLSETSDGPGLYVMSERCEAVLWRENKLFYKADFFHASAYHFISIPTVLSTSIFVMSRLSGWVAHIFEQRAEQPHYSFERGLHRPRAV